jgi:dynein light intermediate chain
LLLNFKNYFLDELIRQITINCAERGLLLLRVRDEARMTISAYETLYESSIAYGVRKALIAEQKKIDLDIKLKELQGMKRDLQQQVENLKATIESTQQRALEKREQEEKAHSEEVSYPLSFTLYSALLHALCMLYIYSILCSI